MTDQLVDHLVGGGTRWHRRFVLRKWADEGFEPQWVTDGDIASVPIDEDDESIRVSFHVQVVSSEADETNPQLRVRAVLQANTEKYAVDLDFEARYIIEVGYQVPDESVAQFMDDVAVDAVMGYLGAAQADAIRSVGLTPPMIPPTQIDEIKRSVLGE